MNLQILINPTEYESYLLNIIGSDNFNGIFNSMNFKDIPECKNAFTTGLAIAGLLTSQVPHYEVIDNEDKVSE